MGQRMRSYASGDGAHEPSGGHLTLQVLVLLTVLQKPRISWAK